ncbi:5-(carboxyamino)imidazole ribonucleotide synthase [Solitalea longa]|uniref:N5-carboxyaminoimidazole ribonucleotide synthase n=1 Tax=Solitalea longa TaxID=2079460 RepID=A0A2S5A4M9_9SPHI|nr:5-(carboxyamino)imidazole ribonucleotide synthase [Solitalea longa]POY37484.1 5-(carboxyamino)imidazole ribonucleotide synthase [Solitalea longa]
MKTFNSSNFKLGILGGGQLGKMLLQPAMNYGVDVSILDPDPASPCSFFCKNFHLGSFNDYNTVYNFGRHLDLITIEIENVNVEALKRLEAEGVTVYPQPHIIELIQDKGLQKDFYKQHNIPTSPYLKIQNREELKYYQEKFPAVQKLRKAGYDGRGVFKINSIEDLPKSFNEPSILEDLIDFDKEIAVLVARNATGEIRTFDVVEMEFDPKANLVELLFTPAKIDEQIEAKAKEIATDVVEKLKIVGLLAVEMFVTKTGEVLVNELAPRPHNSGHHTIEACITSQYEQHLRAILNLPLGSTELRQPAVMVNLLGEDDFVGEAKYIGINEISKLDGVYLHLYGKKFTKPFRKMGHVTIIDHNLDTAFEKAKIVKDTFKIQA